jgi:hypothetical protein
VTKAFANAHYGIGDDLGRGLSLIPVAATVTVAGLLFLVHAGWSLLVQALIPVAMAAGPLLWKGPYERFGRVAPFSYVNPPGPTGIRMRWVYGALVWLFAVVALFLFRKDLIDYPMLPRGVALAAWGASLVAVTFLALFESSSFRLATASLWIGLLLELRNAPFTGMLLLVLGPVSCGLAVFDHRRFRALERRLHALRDPG